MAPTDPGMKLEVDKNEPYIAYYVLTGNIHTMMSVHAIPKADAVAAGGPSLAHLETFANLEIECFPAADLDPTSTNTHGSPRTLRHQGPMTDACPTLSRGSASRRFLTPVLVTPRVSQTCTCFKFLK